MREESRYSKLWDALEAVATPVLATLLGLAVGTIFILISGRDPLLAYQAIYRAVAGEPRMFGETLVSTIPLILAGLSVALAFRCGLFNIGVEGQYLMAQIATTVVGIFWVPPAGLEWIHPILALAAGALAGAFWGSIAGVLKAYRGVHEVINTIMLNYIGLYLADWLLKYYLRPDISRASSYDLLPSSWLKQGLIEGSRLHTGLWVALGAAVIVWIILFKTPIGYEIRAVGFSPGAAEYGGISVQRSLILAMAMAGALAGLAGSVQTLGINHRFNETVSFVGYGFDGIAVALVGRTHPVGVVLAALLFGALDRSGPMMQAVAGVPKAVIYVVQGTVIFFVAAEGMWRFIKRRRAKKEVEAA